MQKLGADKAKKYSKIKTRNMIADIVISVVSIILFQIFFSFNVNMGLERIFGNFYGICFFYSSVFFLFLYILGLPLNFYNSYIIEHRFGLSRHNIKTWVIDELKGLVLSYVLLIVCFEVFYFLLRSFPDTWWLLGAVLWILFTVVLARLFPVFLIPIFYKYSTIEDNELKDHIIDLAGRAKIDLEDVCEIDLSKNTVKANAALVGLGRTRKVILADTLTAKFDHPEILAVVAHEFGHYKYRHMLKILCFNSITTLAGFYLLYLFSDLIVSFMGGTSISDLYLMPVLFLLITFSGILLMPVQNLFSRILERQADRFSLRSIDSPDAFIGAMTKLAEINLAELDPPLLKKIFLYSHPPIKERIEMAKNFRK